MLDNLLKFVPQAHHNAYMGLLKLIPRHVRRICVMGESGAALGYLMKKRPGTQAHGIVHRPELLPVAHKMLDGAALAPDSLESLPVEDFDGLLLCNLERGLAEALTTLQQLRSRLSSHCYVFALFADPDYAPGTIPEGLTRFREEIETGLGRLGFSCYHGWPLEEPGADGGAQTRAWLLMMTGAEYDALEHARSLRASQQHALAYEVIELVPDGPEVSGDRRLLIHWERLQILADWLEAEPDTDRSFRLMAAQVSFYFVACVLPKDDGAYVAMARCWKAVGDTDMAGRLLRSIQCVSPSAAVHLQMERLDKPSIVTPRVEVRSSLGGGRSTRILFLMNPRPHYGIDVLFDGLCDCVGDENVVDYPYKPWLHGQDTEQLKNYPCRFNRAGAPQSLEQVLARLERGEFDYVLFGDLETELPQEEMVAIVQRAKAGSVAIVDALDELTDFRDSVIRHLGLHEVPVYFKREKHRAIDYGPRCYPLPFAYDGRKAMEDVGPPRSETLFWAGHRMFGARRLYLETLESKYNLDLDQKFSPEEYIQRIRTCAFGLNCFGMGFDTVRYWELPAHGAMMLSDRLPIEIPQDFVDGEHALFFDDLPELLEKLDYCLSHPDDVHGIAQRGHAHFLKHHTNEARARQLLGWLRASSDAP